MSKENAKKFLEELTQNDTLQRNLNALNPSSPDELVSFAAAADFKFTKEEMKEALIDSGAHIVSDDELQDVSGGAASDIGVLGEAPGMAMGSLYQTVAQAIANAMYNATSAQQQLNVTFQTATTMGVSHLIGH